MIDNSSYPNIFFIIFTTILLFFSVNNAKAECIGTLNCSVFTEAESCWSLNACKWDFPSSTCVNTTDAFFDDCGDHNPRFNCAFLFEAGCSWNGSTENIDNNSFSTTICSALEIATGTAGKAFAAFAIISVGIGFFTGKVSWGLMIGVMAGVAAMFGAPLIVEVISSESANDCGI